MKSIRVWNQSGHYKLLNLWDCLGMSVATEPAISTLHPAAQRRTDALEKANIFCEGLVTYLWPWAGGAKIWLWKWSF